MLDIQILHRQKKLVNDNLKVESHETFYDELIFLLLNATVNPPHDEYRVFLDIKDTRGKEKIERISKILNSAYPGKSPFLNFQHIHSSENVLIQLTDLLIGAIAYKARGEHLKVSASIAKLNLIDYIEQKFGYALNIGTNSTEKKFNIFDHQQENLSYHEPR